MSQTPEEPDDDVVIFEADRSLQRKLGSVSLDKIFTADVIRKSEKVIEEAAGSLYEECKKDWQSLSHAMNLIVQRSTTTREETQQVVTLAFAVKTKAAQSGYGLISELANSLLLCCESWQERTLAAAQVTLVVWHQKSIEALLNKNISGNGGEIGKSIMREIEKIKPAMP